MPDMTYAEFAEQNIGKIRRSIARHERAYAKVYAEALRTDSVSVWKRAFRIWERCSGKVREAASWEVELSWSKSARNAEGR